MILTLKAPDFLRLKAARGVRLKILSGRAWITENGSPRDSFVGAGTSYAVRGDGLVLVSAERDGAGEVRLEMVVNGAAQRRCAPATRPGECLNFPVQTRLPWVNWRRSGSGG